MLELKWHPPRELPESGQRCMILIADVVCRARLRGGVWANYERRLLYADDVGTARFYPWMAEDDFPFEKYSRAGLLSLFQIGEARLSQMYEVATHLYDVPVPVKRKSAAEALRDYAEGKR